jgi:hypothetical protein
MFRNTKENLTSKRSRLHVLLHDCLFLSVDIDDDDDDTSSDDGCVNGDFDYIYLRVYSKCVMPVASYNIFHHVAIYPVVRQSIRSVYVKCVPNSKVCSLSSTCDVT